MLQDLYGFLREHHALDRIPEILSHSRLEVFLLVPGIYCLAFRRLLRAFEELLVSLPNENNADGVTPADAAVGQFFWFTFA
jgi:hypothetical protein